MYFAKKRLYKSNGFTLAEILITLGIIGVVASMTIPILVNNYTKQATAEKLKKVYSTLSQTTRMAEYDTGLQVSQWFTSNVTDGTAAGAQIFAETYLIPYLQVAKNCGLSSTSDCNETVNSLSPSRGVYAYFDSNYEKFFLNDGTGIFVYHYDTTYNRFMVYVDINGQSKPNTMGKDVFLFFYMSTGKFIPEALINRNTALTEPNYGCNKDGGRGTFCSGLIMMDGWRIADDYPW